MATTVQTSVTSNQATAPFYYLRITGLPYYFFATIKPSSTAFGSFAWSTPTGYPATWAQQGLQLPDDAIEQHLPDIIGGVGTASRCRLSVIDFGDPSHVGKGFFSRLFAPGRTLSDTSIAKAVLANPISSGIGTDSTLDVSGQTGAWTVPGDIYVGAETIGIDLDTPGGTGEHTLQIASRNKYVCYGNSGDGGASWPPQPFHRITVDSGGNVTTAPDVTAEAVDILGRTAALWMGHMRPDGNPEPESSSTCLLLGRIVDIGIGTVGGVFDLTVESITADLAKAKIAPDLGHGTIQDGFYLGGAPVSWRSFYVSSMTGPITIAQNTYATPYALANAINVALAAAGPTFLSVTVITDGDGTRFAFETNASGLGNLGFSSSPISYTALPTSSGAESLLHALGYDPAVPSFMFPGGASGTSALPADRTVAHVFVPCTNTAQSLSLAEPNAYLNFYTDQGDGTSEAWARFGNGCLVKLTATSAGSNAVTTGQSFSDVPSITKSDGEPGFGQFYYVETGGTAMIDQVLVSRTAPATGTFTKFLGRCLASTKGHSSASDGILNVFPESVGMGWNTIMTAADWTLADETGIMRVAFVDNSTKWIDLFRPYAREHGLFVVWNPSTSAISLRRILVPSSKAAGTNVTFSESNRSKPGDRTSQRVDRSNIRTSWKLQPAFDLAALGGHFLTGVRTKLIRTEQVVVVTDARSRSMYPNDDRQEEIQDETMVLSEAMYTIIKRVVDFYSTPWTVCSRSMNKTGMLLAPGTIHKIVDNTMVNPFTGATGIVSGDDVYAFLTRVSMRPSDGSVTVEFAINSTDDISLYRQWSPTALVDFTLNGGGFTRGYNSGSKSLVTTMAYGSNADGDGAYFEIGDTIRVITRDNSDDTATSSQTDTVASIGGGTITVTTGLSALSAVSETIVILQKYNSATTSRKTGTSKVAWQGDGDTRVIQGSSTARLNRWS